MRQGSCGVTLPQVRIEGWKYGISTSGSAAITMSQNCVPSMYHRDTAPHMDLLIISFALVWSDPFENHPSPLWIYRRGVQDGVSYNSLLPLALNVISNTTWHFYVYSYVTICTIYNNNLTGLRASICPVTLAEHPLIISYFSSLVRTSSLTWP